MMAICGSKISPPDGSADGRRQPLAPSGSGPLKHFWLIVLYMVAALSAGCMTLQYGWQAPVGLLKSLSPGISTSAEVLMALGEPRGRGIVRYTREVAPRKIWFYEYVETDGKAVKIKFLLVLFEKEVYDGHLWFFSGSNTETEWFVKTPKASDPEKMQQNFKRKSL
jgi:hypothetical protein